jgi:hypothetical protein
MTALLRLYPRAWRERYGDEMLALLEGQPASPLDHFDLIRGALDAHLHPQVRGLGATDKETSMNQRMLALLAAVGGVIWMAGFAAWLTAPITAAGDRESIPAIPMVAISIALMGIAVGELGTRPGSPSWTGHAIAGASIVFAVLLPLPWLFNVTDAAWGVVVLSLFGFPVLASLAAIRGRQNGVMPTLITAAIVASAAAAWVGYGGSTPESVKWVGLLLGASFVGLAAQTLAAPPRAAESAVV